MFKGKTAIVTGGGNGIGAATAAAFAREGAGVVVADTDGEAGGRVVETINANGGAAIAVKSDVARDADCRRIMADALARFGGVDVLFNNAGIQPLASYARAEALDERVWDRVLDVNLKGCFMMARHALPELRRRAGVIINNASIQGLQAMPYVPAYAASKGGVLALTRQLAVDYARDGVRVLAICPGTVDTQIVRRVAERQGDDVNATLQQWTRLQPMGRVGRPAEIAEVVLFLASPRASFMTGEHVCVDGGIMALVAGGGGPSRRRSANAAKS